MARKQKQDWDLRSNIGATPGSQGTLFSGGKSQMRDERYHRGYTPERLRAVADAVVDPQIKNYTDGRGRQVVRGVESINARSFVARGDIHVDREPVRRMVDTIARSTVPVEHLQNIQFQAYHGMTKPGADGIEHGSDGEHAAGLYSTARNNPNANANGRARIQVAPAFTGGSTVIHEIGHHVSHAVEHTGHSVMRAPAGSGAEEAFADNYAEEHFRDRKGGSQVLRTYGGGELAGHIDRPQEFWTSYHKHRDNRAWSAEIAAGNEEHFKHYPEDRENGDVPLIEKSWVSQDDFKNGRKPEAHLNPDALP